jgi:hypothetical protein
MEGAKAAETLAGEHAQKVAEIAENLHKEVDVERESSAALKLQVELLTKRLEDAQELGLAAAGLYAGTLEQFWGSTSALPSEPLAFNIFLWLKTNFAKLPNSIGSAMHFGVLASATNFSKMLARDGCLQVDVVQERDLKGLGELGTVSRSMRRSVLKIMKSFWVNFGQSKARLMAELHRAEVGYCILRFFFPCLVFDW